MKKPDFSKPISNIETVVEECKDSLAKSDWLCISLYHVLSESFIEKFQDKVDWNYISGFQELSESFIEKFEDKVEWFSISTFQKLSEPFIEKFEDKIHWNSLLRNPNICWHEFSEEFFDKYYQHLDLEEMNKRRSFSRVFCLKYNLDYRWI